MKNKKYWPSSNDPVWLEEGYRINESVFCETFISTHKIVFCNGFFFTEDGRVTDEMPLRSTIYAELKDYASNNVARKVGSILDLLKLSAQVDDFPPVTNCIHSAWYLELERQLSGRQAGSDPQPAAGPIQPQSGPAYPLAAVPV